MKRNLLPIAVAAFLLAVGACASAGPPGATTASTSKANPDSISAAEIETVPSVRNAYDIVQRLRPTWLTKAKSGGISISGSQMSAPGGSGILGGSAGGGAVLVFEDNSRVGDLSALNDISASSISAIRFMDAATATALLPGLSSQVFAGAIVVHLRTGR